MSRPNSIDRQSSIAGRVLTLRFSTKAFAALSDLWQCKNLDEVNKRLSDLQQTGAVDMDRASDLLWASLRAHHREITREEVADLMDENGLAGFQKVIDDLSQAIAASMPAPEAGPAHPPATRRKR